MKRGKAKLRHVVTLGAVANQHLTVTLFGKLVEGVDQISSLGALEHPTDPSEPLHVAQVFGYRQDHQCVRLPNPALILLPKDAGPADDCGWDPQEFVMWRVPSDWTTLLLHPVAGPIGQTLKLQRFISQRLSALTIGQQTLDDWQCDTISNDCVKSITKSTHPYSRSESLQQYDVNSNEQCRAIADVITGDNQLGVGRYQFQLDETTIGDLSPSWTMGQLANRIKEKAVPK